MNFRQLRREYPYLMMAAVDELSEEEMADRKHVPLESVRYKLRLERERASGDDRFLALMARHL